jgi:hypothetical protein
LREVLLKIDAEVNEKVLSRIFVAFAPGTSRTRIILFQIVKLAKLNFCLQILIHPRNARCTLTQTLIISKTNKWEERR